MNEKCIEKRLKDRVERLGGLAWKFVSPGIAGVPDRILLFRGGHMCFVECKRPGETPRPLQFFRIKVLEDLGFMCRVVDSYESVDQLIEEVKSLWNLDRTATSHSR